jgi:apolipoprotein N-acyltransferase
MPPEPDRSSSAVIIDADNKAQARPRRRRLIAAEPWPEGMGTSVGAVWLAWVAGLVVFGIAWLVPETGSSAMLGWTGALLLICALRSGSGYLAAYIAGIIGHVIGFHWVYRTLVGFGGLGPLVGGLICVLFVAFGALAFPAIALIDRCLDRRLDILALRSAAAVVLLELLMPRLFPWHLGYTQLAFTPFVQVAAIGGPITVSFLMFWLGEALVRVVVFRERRRAFLLPVAAFGLSIAYGLVIMDRYARARGEQQPVVIAQGHVEAAERRDLEQARRYLARIFELSRLAAGPGSLVVWPEGAVPAYIPASIGVVGDPPELPWLGDGSAYLVGGFSFLPGEKKFNTAFAVYPDGQVPFPYFKQILIPFGEYMPLASYLPWLKTLNSRSGVFSAGTATRVFDYPMHRADGSAYTLRVAPLICYEDTLPALARKATRQGAELLVNLSSDVWFGRSLAPHQHHLIAAFRAIENRRFLIRSTTTGISAIVDPLGRTIARIPPFSDGTITAKVTLLAELSPYTALVGDRPWWALLAVCAGLSLVRLAQCTFFMRFRRNPRSVLRHRRASLM